MYTVAAPYMGMEERKAISSYAPKQRCEYFIGCMKMEKLFQNDILPLDITVSDAAKYLGLGKKVIYQLLENGELRAARERGKIYIDPCSLREFRNSGKMA
jgi:excisionase family DNA binding protein